ncbi:MAG TPA: FprA family A-type flavoprotein, partial [Synergistales bacterium]|nr:FprA family A-type flavoprotein [Synergistales bacterium]
MAETVARAMAEEGIEKMAYHDISRSHISYVVKDIWKYKGLVLASCTYNTTLFPPMADLIMHLRNKMMKGRMLGILGSYSWSKGALAELQNFADSGDWELVEPTVEVKSAPFGEDLEKCMNLGRNMAQKMKMCYLPDIN